MSTYTYQHSEVATLYNPRRKTGLNRTSAGKPEKHKLTGQEKKSSENNAAIQYSGHSTGKAARS